MDAAPAGTPRRATAKAAARRALPAWGAALAGAALALAGPAGAAGRLLLRQEIIHDEKAPAGRRADFLDTTFFASRDLGYAALTLGSFASGIEAGAWWRDGRRSTYGGFLRRRQGGAIEDTALEFESNQVLGRVLGLVSLRLAWPDRPEDATNLLLVPGLGAEIYYGGWSFASVRAVYDPRPHTGTTFRIANRLGWRRAHFELALAPRTDGVVNWSLAARWRWLSAGWARERDFDFSRLDRRMWSLGLQYDFGS